MNRLVLVFAILFAVLIASFGRAEAKGVVVTLAAPAEYPSGSILIRESKRVLYFVLGNGQAIRYPIAVPKKGKEWYGNARVVDKVWNPAWAAPADVKREVPDAPDYVPGGHPENPMGVAAIVLDRHEIAIHGSNRKMRASIGTAASFGCIRMYNEDVQDLYARIDIGAQVLMKK